MTGKRGPVATDPWIRLSRRLRSQPDGCWLWDGAISTTGYPVFNPTPGRKEYVARWLIARTEPLPAGARLRRTCGRHGCVNPLHHTIELATDRFWAQVESDADCWIWRGYLHGGYGRFNGTLAHRWAYEQLRADIPSGLTLDHLCNTPSCVNPWHLEPVPQSENSRRANVRRSTDVASACPGDPGGATAAAATPPATLADALS